MFSLTVAFYSRDGSAEDANERSVSEVFSNQDHGAPGTKDLPDDTKGTVETAANEHCQHWIGHTGIP